MENASKLTGYISYKQITVRNIVTALYLSDHMISFLFKSLMAFTPMVKNGKINFVICKYYGERKFAE